MNELRRLRAAAGLSLEQVAAAAGVSVSHLSRAERNHRGIGPAAEARVRVAMVRLIAQRQAVATAALAELVAMP